MTRTLLRRSKAFAVVFGFGFLFPSLVRADEVLDWRTIIDRTVALANPPLLGGAAGRPRAIVYAAMFDAVNGIEGQFNPIHVEAAGPMDASRRAAVAQAAYTALVGMFPDQATALTQDLQASLAAIAADPTKSSASIDRGRAWGTQVANDILAWRSTDGFDPSPSTYQGSNATGKWRPTPPGFVNGAAPSLAHTVPFVIPTSSSFRPAGPPALTSAEYTADFNEAKVIGELTSTVRTAEQTQIGLFWSGNAFAFWNLAAASAAVRLQTTLSQNARVFALLNVAMADAAISCWEAKYLYELWRPITAIRLASTDGNPDTVEQADWTPLIVTPPYPEYSSGHATVSGAAQAVLTANFGHLLWAVGTSETLPGIVRAWPSFSAAADEANVARIYEGIHFRTAVRDGRAAGNAIGAFVVVNAAQPVQNAVVTFRSRR